MDDLPQAIKEYWPWVLGGVVGLLLISRYMGGGSGSSGDASLAAFYQAQAAAGAAAQQSAAQNLAAQTQREVALAQLDLSRDATEANARAQWLNATAAMAASVGQTASGVVSALYAPTIAALNAASYENAAALQAGATVAAAGMTAQGMATQAVGEALKGYGGVSQAIQSMPAPQNNAQTYANTALTAAMLLL